jgi:hypothetical protein
MAGLGDISLGLKMVRPPIVPPVLHYWLNATTDNKRRRVYQRLRQLLRGRQHFLDLLHAKTQRRRRHFEVGVVRHPLMLRRKISPTFAIICFSSI